MTATTQNCCARCGDACDCRVPGCLDRSLVRSGERGLCRAALAPDAHPVPLDAPTDWTVDLTAPDARPLEGARIAAGGGMPQHGLPFPEAPLVSALGAGRHRIAGLRFTRRGWWVLRLEIETAAGTDAVTFNLVA
jgi:hypothetical protein